MMTDIIGVCSGIQQIQIISQEELIEILRPLKECFRIIPETNIIQEPQKGLRD